MTRVLMIDDDRDLCLLFAQAAHRADFQWTCTSSGEQALTLIAQNDYDAILLDYKLLGISGAETFAQIKRLKPDARVAVLSGFLSNLLIETISAIGHAVFIPKPPKINQEFYDFLFRWIKRT